MMKAKNTTIIWRGKSENVPAGVSVNAKNSPIIIREKNKHLPAGVSVNVARAFLVYGGLVTGPVTHYFYILLDRLVFCLII